MKSICVLIITYNQKNEIGRSLESVLSQKKWGLKNIIVSDDCSCDGTWEILKEYEKKYPEIIKIYRNNHNLGIYQNQQHLIDIREQADLYYKLSGDDALCVGWFEIIQKFLSSNKINYNIPFGIYSDFKSVYPNGHEIIYKQDLVKNNYSPFSLYLRGKASNRSMIVNNLVLDKYSPLALDFGLNLTESVFDSQDSRIIKNAYYVPYIASIYYSDIGVSTELTICKSNYFTQQNIIKWKYFIKHFITDSRDINYAKSSIYWSKFIMCPNPLYLSLMIWYLYNAKMPYESLNFVSILKHIINTSIVPIKIIKYKFQHIKK